MKGQVLTPRDAAALLGLGKTTVITWCERGILPAVRIDSRWYLKRAELVRDGWLGRDGSQSDSNVTRSFSGEAAGETR